MKQHYLFLLAIGIVATLASCTKSDGIFESTESKLEGSWKFESVKRNKQISIGGKDITSDYENLELIFSSDKNVVEVNSETGMEAAGTWEIRNDLVWNADQTQTYPEVLVIAVGSENIDLRNWESLCVTQNKITCTERIDGGWLRYTLVRE